MSAGGSPRAPVSSRFRNQRLRPPTSAATTTTPARLPALPAAVAAVVGFFRDDVGQLVEREVGCGTSRWTPSVSPPSAQRSGHWRFTSLPIRRRFGLRFGGVHVGSARIETRSGKTTQLFFLLLLEAELEEMAANNAKRRGFIRKRKRKRRT